MRLFFHFFGFYLTADSGTVTILNRSFNGKLTTFRIVYRNSSNFIVLNFLLKVTVCSDINVLTSNANADLEFLTRIQI